MEEHIAYSKMNSNQQNTAESSTLNSASYPNLVVPSTHHRYNVKALHITGGIQILCAVLSVLSGVVVLLVALRIFQDPRFTCTNDGPFTGRDSVTVAILWPILAGLAVSTVCNTVLLYLLHH